jgi:AraC-like DNA-binding protein
LIVEIEPDTIIERRASHRNHICICPRKLSIQVFGSSMRRFHTPRPSDPNDPTVYFVVHHPCSGEFLFRPTEERLAPFAAMDIRMIGLDEVRGHYLVGANKAATHLIYIHLKGELWVEDDRGRHRVPPKHFWWAPAGGYQWIESPGPLMRALWVHLFDTAQWSHLRALGPQIAPLHDPAFFEALLTRCHRELHLESTGDPLAAHHCAEAFAHCLRREMAGLESARERDLRHAFSTLSHDIAMNPERAWTVREMARQIGTSPTRFARLSRRCLNLKPKELVTQLRLQRAADLLAGTTLKLDAIAQMTGYCSAFALSDAFLKRFGERPSQFRERHSAARDGFCAGQ